MNNCRYTYKWEYSQIGIHSYWWQTVRQWSLGAILASLCVRCYYNCRHTYNRGGVLSYWGYAHNGGKLSDGSHVAKYWHRSTRDVNKSVDTHTIGDTLKLGIHSHRRQTVRSHSCSEVTASIYNRRGYKWGFTYNWFSSFIHNTQSADTLTLGTNCQMTGEWRSWNTGKWWRTIVFRIFGFFNSCILPFCSIFT